MERPGSRRSPSVPDIDVEQETVPLGPVHLFHPVAHVLQIGVELRDEDGIARAGHGDGPVADSTDALELEGVRGRNEPRPAYAHGAWGDLLERRRREVDGAAGQGQPVRV